MKIIDQLAEVSRRIGSIGKDQRNKIQNYQFRGIDDVYNYLHPIFAELGIITVPRVIEIKHEPCQFKSGEGVRAICKVEYTFYSAGCEDSIAAVVVGEANDTADKATNKAMSAAYKYAMFQTFSIPTQGEPDADADHIERDYPKTNSLKDEVKTLANEIFGPLELKNKAEALCVTVGKDWTKCIAHYENKWNMPSTDFEIAEWNEIIKTLEGVKK